MCTISLSINTSQISIQDSAVKAILVARKVTIAETGQKYKDCTESHDITQSRIRSDVTSLVHIRTPFMVHVTIHVPVDSCFPIAT